MSKTNFTCSCPMGYAIRRRYAAHASAAALGTRICDAACSFAKFVKYFQWRSKE